MYSCKIKWKQHVISSFFLGNSHLVYAIIRKRNIFHQVCFYDNFLSLLCVLKLQEVLYIKKLYIKDLNTKGFIYPFTNNGYNPYENKAYFISILFLFYMLFYSFVFFHCDGIVEPIDSLLKFLQPKNHDLRHKNLVNLKLTNNTK